MRLQSTMNMVFSSALATTQVAVVSDTCIFGPPTPTGLARCQVLYELWQRAELTRGY